MLGKRMPGKAMPGKAMPRNARNGITRSATSANLPDTGERARSLLLELNFSIRELAYRATITIL